MTAKRKYGNANAKENFLNPNSDSLQRWSPLANNMPFSLDNFTIKLLRINHDVPHKKHPGYDHRIQSISHNVWQHYFKLTLVSGKDSKTELSVKKHNINWIVSDNSAYFKLHKLQNVC